jgi:transposase, IS5 family
MLIVDNKQEDLFGGWVPEEMMKLSDELAFVDKALEDPRILESFLKNAKTTGRHSTPVSTYLRMMYLKHRYEMSYEVLVKEVSDSFKWRVFCHLPVQGKVPDDKTLIKLTGKFGTEAVRTINETVIRQAVEAKVIRGRKMRVDTTVTESNIHYPTDSSLLSDGVRVITRTIKKLKKVIHFKTKFRNRKRAMKRRLMRMIKFLKTKKNKTKKKLKKSKEEVLSIAKAVWANAMAVLKELKKGKANVKGSALSGARLQMELAHWLGLFQRLIDQMQTVLGGNVHISDRLVSLFDEGARPIQKGKMFPKTEFGRKVFLQEAEKGFVTDYQVHQGNPPDAPMLDSAVDRHEDIFGQDPGELAADRGFHAPRRDDELHERGIARVSIPVRGNKTGRRKRTERSAWFRRLQRWRSGGEALISLLKRKYGLRRTRVRGDYSTEVTVGWGCITQNLVRMTWAMGP